MYDEASTFPIIKGLDVVIQEPTIRKIKDLDATTQELVVRKKGPCFYHTITNNKRNIRYCCFSTRTYNKKINS